MPSVIFARERDPIAVLVASFLGVLRLATTAA